MEKSETDNAAVFTLFVPEQVRTVLRCPQLRTVGPVSAESMRGLIIHSAHMNKILSGEKTYEIRNMALQCVSVDEEFYLLRVPPKGQGRNIHGQSVLEVVGTAIFKGCHFMRHEDFDSFEKFHKVSAEQYSKMRKNWKRDNGGCYAWELELGFLIQPPRYLPSGSQAGGRLK